MRDPQLESGDVIITVLGNRYLVVRGIGFFMGLLQIKGMKLVYEGVDSDDLSRYFHSQDGGIREVVRADRVHVEIDNAKFGD